MTPPLPQVRAASVTLWRVDVPNEGVVNAWFKSKPDGFYDGERVEYVARPADIDAALLARVEALERERDVAREAALRVQARLDDALTALRAFKSYNDADPLHVVAESIPPGLFTLDNESPHASQFCRFVTTMAERVLAGTALAPARTKGEDGACAKEAT